MKDLFMFTADADAVAVMKTVLVRFEALGIRPITFGIDRHVGRDSGMVKDGPELIRMKLAKGTFSKVLLLWDHAGSGWESKLPEKAMEDIQRRLDGVTWQNHSGAVVVVPELEEWLWHDASALCDCLRADFADLQRLVEAFGSHRNKPPAALKAEFPKELLESVFTRIRKRRPLPEDFEKIAEAARLDSWQQSQSFSAVVRVLQTWFSP